MLRPRAVQPNTLVSARPGRAAARARLAGSKRAAKTGKQKKRRAAPRTCTRASTAAPLQSSRPASRAHRASGTLLRAPGGPPGGAGRSVRCAPAARAAATGMHRALARAGGSDSFAKYVQQQQEAQPAGPCSCSASSSPAQCPAVGAPPRALRGGTSQPPLRGRAPQAGRCVEEKTPQRQQQQRVAARQAP